MSAMRIMRSWVWSIGALIALGATTSVAQEEGDGAAKLAALLQDPLANLAALSTDNTLGLRGGPDNDESYEINLQPV